MMENPVLGLQGKSALVVGAKRIGIPLVNRLVQEGVDLTIGYRQSFEEARVLQRDASNSSAQVHLVQGSIQDETDVRRMVDQAQQKMGGIWFLINLASEFPRTVYKNLEGSSWDQAMASAKGNYLLSIYSSRVMMKNPGNTKGHIIMFGDWAAGETPYLNHLPYLIAKSSVEFMGRGFAVELSKYGVLVNTISPGPTFRPTAISEKSWARNILTKTPLQRESSAHEIAEMIITLLRSETITGETIRIDAGRHLGNLL